MGGITEDERLHGHVLHHVPSDAFWKSYFTFAIFTKESANHGKVGICAYSVLVALSGTLGFKISAGFILTVGSRAVVPYIMGVCQRVGQHLQQILLHGGFFHEFMGYDTFGGGIHLIFRAALNTRCVGVEAALRQLRQRKMVVCDAASAVAPTHLCRQSNGGFFLQFEFQGIFRP